VHGVGLAISLDLHASHPVELAEVRDFDVLAQTGLELLNEAYVAGGDGAVVHMDRDDCDFIFGFVVLVEDGLVD
jgi:hypothetical protein